MIKVVSFNLRCVWDGDGINGFIHRAGEIYDKIQQEKPDIIGFQEVIPRQREWMEWMEKEYTIVGQFRSEDFSGEGTFVAIKKASFEVLAFDSFWLSPTPYVAGSRYEEQSPCPRICNFVKVRNKDTGRIYRVINTHLDHESEQAQIQGLQCIFEHLKELDDKAFFPLMLMGDFNAEPGSETIQFCNGYQNGMLKDVTDGIQTTFHNYGRQKKDCKIDYIYLTSELAEKVVETGIWDDVHEGIYLSDHYPVYTMINE